MQMFAFASFLSFSLPHSLTHYYYCVHVAAREREEGEKKERKSG